MERNLKMISRTIASTFICAVLAATVHQARAANDPLYTVLLQGAAHYNSGDRSACRAEYRACLETLQMTTLPASLKSVVDDALAREQGEPTDEDAAFLMRGAIDKVRKELKASNKASCACTSTADCTCPVSACNCASCGVKRTPVQSVQSAQVDAPPPGPGYMRTMQPDGRWGPWQKMATPVSAPMPTINYNQGFIQSSAQNCCAGSF